MANQLGTHSPGGVTDIFLSADKQPLESVVKPPHFHFKSKSWDFRTSAGNEVLKYTMLVSSIYHPHEDRNVMAV